MYRAKTVREIERRHERREQKLLEIIREQNDRLMHLTGRPWEVAPADLAEVDEPKVEHEDEDFPGFTADREAVGL